MKFAHVQAVDTRPSLFSRVGPGEKATIGLDDIREKAQDTREELIAHTSKNMVRGTHS